MWYYHLNDTNPNLGMSSMNSSSKSNHNSSSSSTMMPRSILKDPNALSYQQSVSGGGAIWKKVCFDDVHIREYAFCLGDNPAVSKGAPLQIDWDYHNEDVIDVDIFEHCREPVRRHRRKLVLSARRRAKILLSAGHTVDEIADMTLNCQSAKKQRVESIKSSGGQWDIGNLNVVNLAEFLGGTAEVTGRTLKMVGLDVMGKAGMEVVKGTGKLVLGTGKVAGDVVLGTGIFAKDVVVGAGTMTKDVVVGTGRVGYEVVKGTGKVVVGTGKVATDVVVGTGNIMRRGTEEVARGTGRVVVGTGNVILGTLQGTGRAARRLTNIFAQGDVIRGTDLKETKQHLRHVEPGSGIFSAPTSPESKKNNNKNRTSQDDSFNGSFSWGNKSITKERGRGKQQRRNTEMPRFSNSTTSASLLSPKRSPTRASALPRSASVFDEDDVFEELAEMEEFMLHLQGMDPDQIKQILSAS